MRTFYIERHGEDYKLVKVLQHAETMGESFVALAVSVDRGECDEALIVEETITLRRDNDGGVRMSFAWEKEDKHEPA